MKQFEAFISRLADDPRMHARFVNTLSMLEYIGARKIFKSLRAESFSLQFLEHAAEEIRHARLLKTVALKMSHGELDSYREEHLFCGGAARRYFQTVDYLPGLEGFELKCTEKYVLTTLLIEERALQIYPVYDPILSACGFPGVLKAILKDEARHLRDVGNELKVKLSLPEGYLAHAYAMERSAFEEFLLQLQRTRPRIESQV